MEKKSWKEFHNDLSWSTRIYTLAVLLVIVFSHWFDAWSTNWTMTIIAAIAGILFLESFAFYFIHHPRAWKAVRWILILLVLALLLTGAYRL